MKTKALVPVETREQKILLIREHKVILAGDLAELYGVEVRRLNEQVKRIVNVSQKILCFNLLKKKLIL